MALRDRQHGQLPVVLLARRCPQPRHDLPGAGERIGWLIYFTYGNAPALVTHFDGITAVPGGFNLVAISSAQPASMAFIPATGRRSSFGRATWYPVNVAASPLCDGGCTIVTGNTVYENRVVGLYTQVGSPTTHTYLATVSRR